jgi:hypothetical protein
VGSLIGRTVGSLIGRTDGWPLGLLDGTEDGKEDGCIVELLPVAPQKSHHKKTAHIIKYNLITQKNLYKVKKRSYLCNLIWFKL